MKVVLANGCFDIFHYGHLLYLEEAATMGDRLVVSVTRNRSVNKGPHRPMFDERQRVSIIKALRIVREVLLVDDPIEAMSKVKPDIFVKGQDYKDTIRAVDRAYCKRHGIEIRFTNTPMYSATKIINDRLRSG